MAALLLVAGVASGCTDEPPDPELGSASGSVSGSVLTTEEPAADAPVLGAWHDLVTVADHVVLVNGYPEGEPDPGPLELWRWTGEEWERLDAGGGPSGRNFAGVAVDGDGRLVLHGGLTAGGASDETWIWDGSGWTNPPAGDGPGPRSSPAMAHDAASGLTVLYGGDDGLEQHGDTWTFDGETWQQVARRGPRPVRWPGAMEADPEGGVVLYGGHQVVDEDGPPAIGDTWVWRGSGWRRVPGGGAPGPLVNASSLVHPEHGLLLLGGGDLEGRERGRVWRWTGDGWERLSEGRVAGRQAFGSAYDPARDVVVLTGGLVAPGSLERHQDVWEWDGDPSVPARQVR